NADGTNVDANGVPVLPGQENNNQVASLQPPANAQPVTRQAMVGAWTVSTAGSNCQIFLALTKWSGGYRAASRGCSAPAISDVQAWDVKDKQVVLVNSAGGTAATLYRSSDQRYDGSTNGGGAISFTR
ncbi:MAG: protease inhibitor Inh/omp19 family protein, partial [Hyphomicrobiales bacterium]|nr:protease inhibitor Inh/omp19 family protein [Hyphomicrobiales bacterium]